MDQKQAAAHFQFIKEKVHPIYEHLLLEIVAQKPDDVVTFMIKWLKEKGYKYQKSGLEVHQTHTIEQLVTTAAISPRAAAPEARPTRAPSTLDGPAAADLGPALTSAEAASRCPSLSFPCLLALRVRCENTMQVYS